MYDFNRNKEEDSNKIYSIIQKISSNSNKYELYKVKNKKTGDIFAAKIIKEYNNNILEKIKSLKKFESPYIVQFYNSFINNNNIWIITEFCDCGSVLDIMKITNKCYKESEIASIIVMVLKGLQYLHLQKKYHGGIKPSNILINNDGVVKLSDYNISNQLLNITNLVNNNNNMHKNPPELMNKNNYNNYTSKCDIWYLGLTCIELAEGSLSLNSKKSKEKNNNKNDNNIINKTNNNLWSLEFIDFIQKCLNENPMNRPSAASLLNHPFILNNNKGKIIIKKKIYNIKGLIDIYREKIDEQEEKININDNNYDIGKDSLEITSFNENLSLSQSDEINNNNTSNYYKIKHNMSVNINNNQNTIESKSKNKSVVLNNNKETQNNKKIKIKKIKYSIKNTQIQNNNNNLNNKTNEIIKKNRGHANSQVSNHNQKISSLKKGKISLDLYEKNNVSYNNYNNANGIISNDHLNKIENNTHNNNHQNNNNNQHFKKKRHSMINKYIKNNNNKNNQIRNDINVNAKNNNTQENIYPKNNNIIKLLNKFEKEKIGVNKNTNKSQRINRTQNIFFLTDTPHNNKKVRHKNNYSIKINNNKHTNIFKEKTNKNNKSLSSIDSLRNSNKDKKQKNNNTNNNNLDKKTKSKTRNKKSNGGNQNLSELIESNKYSKKMPQKKNKLLRNLILNNSGKNIISECNNNINNNNNINKEINTFKINSNEKIYNNKLNNSSNINTNNKNVKKKENEYKFPDININNINHYSKTPMVFYFKSGEIKKLKRPPLSHSSKKSNCTKKIKQNKKVSYKINTNNINNNIIIINDIQNIQNKTNISINENNNKTDYLENINKNYDKCQNNNQSYSYHRNDKNILTEEEIKILYMNGKLNERGLPELITELAGLENKMNQEIQKIKDLYEPIIKQHKEGIKFLKQNPFLKNLKEYKNYENFKKKMKLNSIDDVENNSISSSVHNLNKIKISFYQSNDIEELNISANKNIFDKTRYQYHGLIKI